MSERVINGIDIEQWMPLVHKCAAKAARRSCGIYEAEEFVGVGWAGLKHAATRFDHSCGLKFITYAQHCIDGYIKNHIRSALSITSNSEKVHIKRHGGTPMKFSAFADDSEFDVRDHRTVDGGERDFQETVERMLSLLDPRSAAIVRARFLEGATLQEIGDQHRISRERVRQIIERARAALADLVEPPMGIAA